MSVAMAINVNGVCMCHISFSIALEGRIRKDSTGFMRHFFPSQQVFSEIKDLEGVCVGGRGGGCHQSLQLCLAEG